MGQRTKKGTKGEQNTVFDGLDDVFNNAVESNNFGLLDLITRDIAYGGSGFEHPNPVQALVILKAKARTLDESDPRFDETLLFMASIIVNEDVNPENAALLRSLKTQDRGADLISYIADGDFDGFDGFASDIQERLVNNAQQALHRLKTFSPSFSEPLSGEPSSE